MTQKINKITSKVAPFTRTNVDTDLIIPARYLKTISRAGLAEGLFYSLRYDPEGNKKPFILDEDRYIGAKILITGDNFGCGSSREHAPWALLDAGIACLIGPSFADIFYSNCMKNGILPIVLPDVSLSKLQEYVAEQGVAELSVDLEEQTIRAAPNISIFFEFDPWRKHCLLNGLDDIGLTLQMKSYMDKFTTEQTEKIPWLYAHGA